MHGAWSARTLHKVFGFVDFLRPLMLRKDEYLGEVFVSGFNMSAISGTPLMRILVLP